MEPVEFLIDDLLRLRKPHPCGGFEWRVYRLGADIGIRCTTCNRHVLIEKFAMTITTSKASVSEIKRDELIVGYQFNLEK